MNNKNRYHPVSQDSEMNAVRECLKIQKMTPLSTKTGMGSNQSKKTSGQGAAENQGSRTLPPGLRTITLLDTNCDPELADLFIPANDDSAKSLTLLLDQFTTILSD